MKFTMVCGLAVCLVGLATAGPASADGLHTMGQDWSTYKRSLSGPVHRQGGQYHMKYTPHSNIHHERYATWSGHYTTSGAGPYGKHGGYCPPPGGYCMHGVLCHQCPQCGAGRQCNLPTHHHYFSYSEPTGLVYPPAWQPPAVVQYPYYTTKGPDDFFLDRTPAGVVP